MIVIQATSQHVPAIAKMAAETFVENFGQYFTPEKLEAIVAKSYSHEQIQADLDSGEQVHFLCNDADPEGLNPLGFCQIRCKDPRQASPELSVEYPGPCWEIRRCYVLRGSQGKNAGSLLLEAVLSRVKEAGARTVWLLVLNENVKAQRFYEKFGLANTGHSFFYMAGPHSLLVKQL
ncbi:hypothetical protein CcCBS67573_g10619 [Chytriomyces confervae]|uniref:N-acetyltransferase domain-containing protein n=1 Tax=Chytriomyces confervae TaxID=246404 RepID=A0A507CN36_9FUNG|nr:hypothetical protein CcCBS67573_g10619 [Chytriomyces confervae]